MSAPDANAERCPLCGQSNRCAIEAGAPAASCWCMVTPIAPEALAAIAPALRGQACLCPACASGKGLPAIAQAPGAADLPPAPI